MYQTYIKALLYLGVFALNILISQFESNKNQKIITIIKHIMSHSKSTILSKAEKMKQKRNEKRERDPPIVQIIDSEDSNRPEFPANPSDKVSKQLKHNTSQQQNNEHDNKIQETVNSKSFTPNPINFDRFKKIQSSGLSQRKPILLKTEICGDGLEISNYQGRHLVGYKIAGSDSTKYISENHLRQRAMDAGEDLQKIEREKELKQLEKQEKKKEKRLQQDGSENSQRKDQKSSEKGEQGKKKSEVKVYRYFDVESSSDNVQQLDSDEDDMPKKKSQKCFRCGEKGHIAKNCYMEAKTTCMFCLGDHHHTQCTDKLCFRCNQTGHVSQQCKASGKKCNRCRKVGHIEKDCGTIIMLDYSSIRDGEIRDRYSEEDLRRLKCLAECRNRKGHFNCFQYGPRPQKIYGSSQKQPLYRY